MKTLIFLLILITCFSYCPCKDKSVIKYAASTISPALKKNACAVCRNYHREFELLDYGKAMEKVSFAVTILNEKGSDFNRLVVPYDKSIKILSISGNVYDQEGNLDNKLKTNVIQDVNYAAPGTIYDDIRIKTAAFTKENFPYTVEYQYEIEHNGIIGYPDWNPVDEYDYSIEKSTFTITWPENLEIRIKEFNLPAGCRTEKKTAGKVSCTWRIDSLTTTQEEVYSPGLKSITPRVITAPSQFIFDGSEGKMNTWNDFGLWIFGLNKDLDELTEVKKTEIRNMVKDMKDTVRIISRLYEYMQSRTRYVGIQLGLGGYKPFPAETTDRLGYGDCKALSNYMKAILNCAGIPSVYVIAGAGENKGIVLPDFPTVNQNNHALLCIPLQHDTIWLECTSQTVPGGYTGSFTAGRTVLGILPEGGMVTKIPMLNQQQNCRLRNTNIEIDQEGFATIVSKAIYKGYQYENLSGILHEGRIEQEKYLSERLGIPGLALQGFSFQETRARIPEIKESISFTSPLLISKTGNRFFIPLFFLNRQITSLPKYESRKMPVIQKLPFSESDTTIIQLPDGFQTESIPKEKLISTPFGEYKTIITQKGNQITCIRYYAVNNGNWPKESYEDFSGFFYNVSNSDKLRLVLKKIQP